MSNICIAPVDTSSSVSQQSSVIGSTDEGGFNEPSPEIKAKLKPAYSFETTASAESASVPEKRDDFNENDYNAHQHSLHYVDFGYRLNPDGSESKQCFSEETDDYVVARNNHSVIDERDTVVSNVVLKKTTVHYPVTDSVVYAAIKSEPTSLSPPPPPPPIQQQPIETKYNCVNRNYRIEDDYTNDTDNVSDIDEKFEQLYSSTANDKDDDIVDLNGDVDGVDDDIDDIDDAVDQAAFDLDNVEYADASEKDDLPDAMTSYEADRLLSSRWVPTTGPLHLCKSLAFACPFRRGMRVYVYAFDSMHAPACGTLQLDASAFTFTRDQAQSKPFLIVCLFAAFYFSWFFHFRFFDTPVHFAKQPAIFFFYLSLSLSLFDFVVIFVRFAAHEPNLPFTALVCVLA